MSKWVRDTDSEGGPCVHVISTTGMVGKMAKDIGIAIRKNYCGIVSTLFGCFFGIPSLHGSSFFIFFFVTCFCCFFGGTNVPCRDVLS